MVQAAGRWSEIERLCVSIVSSQIEEYKIRFMWAAARGPSRPLRRNQWILEHPFASHAAATR